MAKKLDGTKRKTNAGRPPKFTEEIRKKMEEIAMLDGSIPEMAYYCGVTKQTVYDWLRKDPAFSDHLMRLREKPVLIARQRVVQGLKESYPNAMDYLKRKRRMEFGDSHDVTSGGKPIQVSFDNAFAPKTEGDSTESSEV